MRLLLFPGRVSTLLDIWQVCALQDRHAKQSTNHTVGQKTKTRRCDSGSNRNVAKPTGPDRRRSGRTRKERRFRKEKTQIERRGQGPNLGRGQGPVGQGERKNESVRAPCGQNKDADFRRSLEDTDYPQPEERGQIGRGREGVGGEAGQELWQYQRLVPHHCEGSER